MLAFSAVVFASPFLRQRMAGLTGVARTVIQADLAGARSIYVVSPDEIAPDWMRSFAIRKRPLPEVTRVARREDIPARDGELLLILPEELLLTLEGIRHLRDQPGSALPTDPAYAFAAGPAAAITRRIFEASMKSGEGWVIRNVDRPISTRLAALIVRHWDVSPNAVSVLCFALAIVMGVVLAQGGQLWLAAGGLLFQAVMVIDCVDGDIARVTHTSSRFGAALDTALDMLSNLAFVVGLMIGLVRTYGYGELAMPTALAIVAAVCILLMTVLVRLGPGGGSFDVVRPALAVRLSRHPRLKATVLVIERLFKRDFYTLFFAVLSVVGLAWFIPRFGLVAVCIWLLAILWCAPVIVADKAGALLPDHIKAP